MRDLLFGIETEYALSGSTGAGTAISPAMLAHGLIDAARVDLCHLSSNRGSDLFLANGGRFYIDCGSHPEIATPECLDPWDAVRYVRAGERIMTRLASRVLDIHQHGGSVLVHRANVDYSGMGTTWGCHESYLCRSAEATSWELVPHLISRIIITGAGGFNPLSPGLAFTLSPRSAFTTAVRSRESTSQRGILHSRQEPLARDYDRLHIIFGESLCSDLALWLKVGTTALVTAMIEAGVQPTRDLHFVAPLEALRVFAANPTCRAKELLGNGRWVSALDVQRHLLGQVEKHRTAAFMPAWVDQVCTRWAQVLDLLERAPESVSTCLDWAIKYALYVDHADRCGFSWASIPAWANVLSAGSKATSVRAGEFLKLRQQLFEIDLRFGLLGEGGIFAVLDRAGALTHQVDAVGDAAIAHAMDNPPPHGRARVRGEAVRRLSSDRGRYSCYWTDIRDEGTGRVLDLSDPFERTARWRSPAAQAAADLGAAR